MRRLGSEVLLPTRIPRAHARISVRTPAAPGASCAGAQQLSIFKAVLHTPSAWSVTFALFEFALAGTVVFIPPAASSSSSRGPASRGASGCARCVQTTRLVPKLRVDRRACCPGRV
eukprot:1323726-Rhodomonas_salina.2